MKIKLPKMGVYCIRNIVNNKIYVGKSVHIYRRRIRHFNELRGGIHHSWKLQKDFRYYGQKSFIFEVIEVVNLASELCLRESHWIKFYDCVNTGYNVIYESRDLVGELNPFFGKKHTEESKRKMSENHADTSGEKNPNYGKEHSVEAKQKISQARAKRYLLINPNNEIVEITNMKKFCRDNYISSPYMFQVVSGDLASFKGWRLPRQEDITKFNNDRLVLA